jgi:SAM-dependent methyltransferase
MTSGSDAWARQPIYGSLVGVAPARPEPRPVAWRDRGIRRVEFTGERYVPGTKGLEELYVEHVSRYVFATDVARGRKVLDIGCGCGYGSHYLAMCQADLVLGVDTSPESLGFARSQYSHPNLRFALMDAQNLGFKGCFDVATCFEVIEHVDDAQRLLREARAALEEDGFLLVSTPNRLTYVAGGEGGVNPFHTREYDVDEFTELLGSVFSHVRMFGQHWVEGMTLSLASGDREGGRLQAVRLPDRYGSGEAASAWTESPYFIAACAKCDVLDAVARNVVPAVLHSTQPRHDRQKTDMKKLEDEFDLRGRWAMDLDLDNRRKDQTIKDLQSELQELKAEFDQRGDWAKTLDAQVEDQRSAIKRLESENAELRRVAQKEQRWTKTR